MNSFSTAFKALFEFAPKLGAGHQRSHVEPHELSVSTFGHVAFDDADGQSFDDRGFADAGFADEHGIVLGPPRQDLNHATDFVVAPDDRIQLPWPANWVRSRPYFSSD